MVSHFRMELAPQPVGEQRKIKEPDGYAPQVLSRSMEVEIDSPHVGKTRDVGSPIKVSGLDQVRYGYPPALGEHTEHVLKDLLGYSADKIDVLENQNVV